MTSNEDCLRKFINKENFFFVMAMQKIIAFSSQQRGFEVVKLALTSSNLANVCLHKFTDGSFYPFAEGDKVLQENSEKLLLVLHIKF